MFKVQDTARLIDVRGSFVLGMAPLFFFATSNFARDENISSLVVRDIVSWEVACRRPRVYSRWLSIAPKIFGNGSNGSASWLRDGA